MGYTGIRYRHPLKTYIKAMGMTQAQFAEACGLSPTTINNIIAGRYRGNNKYQTEPRRYETIMSIAAVLKVSHRTAERICNGERIY